MDDAYQAAPTVRGTWIEGHKLYIALRLMRSGSMADIIRVAWQAGVPEEVAKKLEYEGVGMLTSWAPQQMILAHPVRFVQNVRGHGYSHAYAND